MVFSSYLFLFYLLPLALAAYYVAPIRRRNLILSLFSYLFYGWANPIFLFLLIGTTLLDYTAGLLIARSEGVLVGDEYVVLGNGPSLLGRLSVRDKEEAVEECRALTNRLAPGFDFTREIALTDQLALGDTVLLRDRKRLLGFALCHTAPLVEGRVREEMRVLKLALEREEDLPRLADILVDYARRSGTRRVALRVQTEFIGAYQRLIDRRARVRWTDLRMTLADMPERPPQRGVIWSNWEI